MDIRSAASLKLVYKVECIITRFSRGELGAKGVDVGAKEEIHNIIRELSKEGCSIIVFSTELPEIVNLCDRIILMYEGEIRKDLKNHKDIDSEEIMHIITGGKGGAS